MDFKFGKELIKALYKIRDAIKEEDGGNDGNDGNGGNGGNSESSNSPFTLDDSPIGVVVATDNGVLGAPMKYGWFEDDGQTFVEGKYCDINDFNDELKIAASHQSNDASFIFIYDNENISMYNFCGIYPFEGVFTAPIANDRFALTSINTVDGTKYAYVPRGKM